MANERTPLLKSAAPTLTTEALRAKQELLPGYTMSYQGMMISMSMDQRTQISSDDTEPNESASYANYLYWVHSSISDYSIRGLRLFSACLPYLTSLSPTQAEPEDTHTPIRENVAEGASLIRNPSNKAELFELAQSQWTECGLLRKQYHKIFKERNLGWTTTEELELIEQHNKLARDCFDLLKQAADAGRDEAAEFLQRYFSKGPDSQEMSPKPPVLGF